MRYIIGFLITIGLIILALTLLFRGGDDTPANQPRKLVDYANTATAVRLIIDYPVSAEQTHRQEVITVSRDAAEMRFEQGYQGNVIRSQTYDNNPEAYAHFLRALEVAGFNRSEDAEDLREWRGYCPDGRRYLYEIVEGSRTVRQLWSTSCGNIGSFKGNATGVNALFVRQIPDYYKLTGNRGGAVII